ncbi:MAG TPA: glucosyl-3-phosphoglycerate synthase [Spirochaetia bacterium]|nr:glucosyl-3-phosphoglycerate synthase [Spirochaetia bacterium]
MKGEGRILQSTFHHKDFKDKAALVRQKEDQRLKISLAFPTLNEEATIGKEVLVLKTELMDRFPLLDEIVVIDSGSTDRTREAAAANGARVFSSADVLKKYGSYRGKGENLWKSLYVLAGDIIVWIDADIANIAPKFVYGLVGPLLRDRRISYVKAFYERPIRAAGELVAGGGRVTEILVRPLFSLFYPELACLVQPLSGEYAGRRALLEQLPFSVGYGVELGHLIDIYHQAGIEALAQVNMDRRVHRNQSLQALGKMAFGILQTLLRRLEKYGEARMPTDIGLQHYMVTCLEEQPRVEKAEILSVERPPMMEVQEYKDKFHPAQKP